MVVMRRPWHSTGQRQAREHGLAVDQHRARPALAELAAVLGAGEVQVLAEHLEQGLVGGHEKLAVLAVHLQGQTQLHAGRLLELRLNESTFK